MPWRPPRARAFLGKTRKEEWRRNMSVTAPIAKATTVLLLFAIVFVMGAPRARPADADDQKTTTPIKHVVVIFKENVSFDHYFATYPCATNPNGEPRFNAKGNTPTVNGLNP